MLYSTGWGHAILFSMPRALQCWKHLRGGVVFTQASTVAANPKLVKSASWRNSLVAGFPGSPLAVMKNSVDVPDGSPDVVVPQGWEYAWTLVRIVPSVGSRRYDTEPTDVCASVLMVSSFNKMIIVPYYNQTRDPCEFRWGACKWIPSMQQSVRRYNTHRLSMWQ